MSNIEDEVVSLKFDNQQFESAAKTSLSTLDKLKQALNFTGAGKGLSEIQQSTSRFSMAGIINGTGEVSKSFLAMSTIAVTALATITKKAVETGLGFAKSIALDPLIAGFQEYSTNLNSIQTILANTKDQGSNLDDVNKALQQLNKYSDKTIYNFGEMARNIGTFTAAGVDLDTSVQSIKGIANLAALSGSNSQQASTAMYQLSQAIAAGKVGLQDWNSVVNAGMGGAVFQKALANTASAMGEIGDKSIALEGPMKKLTINGQSFRESIMAQPGQESWLTSDVLTNTLKQFTGDLSKAELQAQGFNDAQIKAIQQTAKSAEQAATKVKTIQQVFDVAKETVGSGWSKTFQMIFGDFGEARSTFTSLSNTINGFINTNSNARNKVLKDWKELGGRSAAIDTIKFAFKDLVAIIKPIRNAFRDIFPATSGKQLADLTKNIRDFVKGLLIGGDTANNLRKIFRGFFAAIDIGFQIVKAVIGIIGDLFGAVSDGSGGFLDAAANVGDFITKLDKTLKKTDGVRKFFDQIGQVLLVPIELLKVLGAALSDVFAGFTGAAGDTAGKAFDKLGDRLTPLQSLLKTLYGALHKVGDFLEPFAQAFADAFGKLGDAMANALDTGDFDGVLDLINTGLLGGILLLVKKFFSKGLNIDFGGGLLQGLKGTFGELTNTLKAMQTNIKADTLLKIAGAVGILTASIVVLSLIDSAALTKSLAAITVGFAQLLGAMAILDAIGSNTGFVKIPFIAGSMILLSTAILVLAGAVKILSTLSWEELAKGLIAVRVLIGGLASAVAPLSASSGGMVRAGAGLILVAFALKILASAVKDFAELSWKEMVKGLVGVGAGLGALALGMSLMPTNILLQSVALIAIGIALKILASALQDFAGFSWKDMGKGLVGIAGALLVIAGAMQLMPPNMVLQAAALVLVGLALQGIAKAIGKMGGMSWSEIGKGLVTLAGALGILAVALIFMSGTLAGSAALLVAAAALAILTPVLVTLGGMSWESIAKGMVTLAGTFVILGLAGLLLTPLAPSIALLGLALLGMGAGLALAGAGALAFAAAFSIFVAAGIAGISLLTGFAELVPLLLQKFAEGIIQFAVTIGKNAGEFVAVFEKLLIALLDAIIKIIPKIAQALTILIQNALKVMRQNIPAMVNTGFALITGILTGIRDHIGEIVEIAADIVIRFLDKMGDKMPQVVDAGIKFIIKLMEGIAQGIRENQDEFGEAALDIADAIGDGLVNGIWSLVDRVVDAAKGLGHKALDAFKDVFDVFSPSKQTFAIGEFVGLGLAKGMEAQGRNVERTAGEVAHGALDTMRVAMSSAVDTFNKGVDVNPTITPVLDLTRLQQDAAKIGGYLTTAPVRADLSYQRASDISTQVQTTKDVPNFSDIQPKKFEFNQTNSSPKALSEREIYLNTKNLLSLAKEALDI